MKVRAIAVVVAIVVLSGCQAAPKRVVSLASPFIGEQTEKMLASGSNKISGSAFLRQKGGGVVTCAGSKVAIYPATAYAAERVRYIYRSESSAFMPFYMVKNDYVFSPDEPRFHTLVRETVCDAQGNFEFDSISDGEFFVFTSVNWRAGQHNFEQGGILMQKISVTGGQTKKMVLSH